MTSKQRRILDTGLFIFGCVGVVATAVMSGRDTLKAEKILKEKNIQRKEVKVETEELAPGVTSDVGYEIVDKPFKKYALEVVKESWKCYIPTAVTMTLTLSAFIVSKRLSAKQIAILSTTLASTGGLLTRYRNEIKERYGDDILSEIDKKAANDNKTWTTSKDNEPMVDGEIDIYDTFTKTWFKTTKMAFVTAKYLMNEHFALGSEVPLKMFYNIQGIDLPDEYENYGWSWEGFNDGYIWIDVNLVNKGDHYEMSYDYDPFELGGATCG